MSGAQILGAYPDKLKEHVESLKRVIKVSAKKRNAIVQAFAGIEKCNVNKIVYEQIHLQKILGYGTYGEVWLASLYKDEKGQNDETLVACKSIHQKFLENAFSATTTTSSR